MTTAVLLTTMRCNITCDHCSVDSHPHRNEHMPVEVALSYLRGLSAAKDIQHVDISGGEPLIHLNEVKRIATEARRLGISMRLTSNGFWAGTLTKATGILGELREAGVAAVGLSIDEWHLPFITKNVVTNYITACREVGMQPLLSAVVRSAPSGARRGRPVTEIAELLVKYGLDQSEMIAPEALEAHRNSVPREMRLAFDQRSVQRWVVLTWQILTGEGRGRSLDCSEEPYGIRPPESCPAAGDLPTIDTEGRLFPCCSPWISRKNHAFGSVSQETMPDDLERMRRSALVHLMHDLGPEHMIRALVAEGVAFNSTHSGICNQCGQLLDQFSLAELEAAAAYLIDQQENAQIYQLIGIAPRLGLLEAMAAAAD